MVWSYLQERQTNGYDCIEKLEENNFYPKQLCGKLEVAANFCFEGVYKEEIPWGNGHINNTYRVTFENEQGVKRHYILQQMNKSIFKTRLN